MFNQFIYYPIFGRPLLMWDGLLTIFFFFVAAYFGYMALHGKAKITQHLTIVLIALTLAVIHGILGLIAYL